MMKLNLSELLEGELESTGCVGFLEEFSYGDFDLNLLENV